MWWLLGAYFIFITLLGLFVGKVIKLGGRGEE